MKTFDLNLANESVELDEHWKVLYYLQNKNDVCVCAAAFVGYNSDIKMHNENVWKYNRFEHAIMKQIYWQENGKGKKSEINRNQKDKGAKQCHHSINHMYIQCKKI